MITDYLTGEKYEGRRSSGIPPTPYIFLSVYIEFVFSKMQTTPRIGFWLDNSNQTPQQTVETILNVRKPV